MSYTILVMPTTGPELKYPHVDKLVATVIFVVPRLQQYILLHKTIVDAYLNPFQFDLT